MEKATVIFNNEQGKQITVNVTRTKKGKEATLGFNIDFGKDGMSDKDSGPRIYRRF